MAERRLPDPDSYPNNSDRAKTKPEQAPVQVQKVTKGKVTQKKPSLARRFAKAFGAREGQGVIEYILMDIIIPATKDMLVDSIVDGAEMAILGEVRGRRRGSGRARYSYDRVSYREDDRRDMRRARRDYSSSSYDDRRDSRRAPSDYESINFEAKADAEACISGLIELIDVYGSASVADLYDLAGISADYTVGNYGWTNLSTATTRRDRDGYYLDLPRPRLL